MPGAKSKPTSVSFTATLRRVGINLLVDVPKRVTAHFGQRGYVPVRATVGGKGFPQTLVPVGEGRHVLYVNIPMLRAAVKKEGERIAVSLVADATSRMPEPHPALEAALAKNQAARAAFDALTPSRRKDVLRYLHNLKSEAAAARNVERFVKGLASASGDLPMGM